MKELPVLIKKWLSIVVIIAIVLIMLERFPIVTQNEILQREIEIIVIATVIFIYYKLAKKLISRR